MKQFQAAIFDLDGTLLDTIEDLAAAMNWGLEKYGFPALPLAHHKAAVGNGLKKYAERSIPQEACTPELLDQFVKEVGETYQKNSKVKTAPFPGISELLTFLKEQGISVHVLSNKRDAFVKDLIIHYFGEGVFGQACGERVGVPKKPDPTGAIEIAKELCLSPEKILFIGDSVYDVICGKDAGMHTIAVSWGYQSEEQLMDEKPDFFAKTPHDIMDYLKD